MENVEGRRLKYLMSTFIPIKEVVVVTKMFSDANGRTEVLKATKKGTPKRGEKALEEIEHADMHDIGDLKRIHGKRVTNFFSTKFFQKMQEKRAKETEDKSVFFRLHILIKQYGIFLTITKRYATDYATVRFFTESFTYGEPEAVVTEIKRLKAQKYASILRESFKLLHIIRSTINSVEERVLPIKKEILKDLDGKIEEKVEDFKVSMEKTIKKLKKEMIQAFIE